jgi:hypothetical protein
MQTNRKTLSLLIIAAGLIIIFLIIYFAFLKKATPLVTTPGTEVTGQLTTETETGTTTPGDKPRNRQEYNIAQEAPHKINAADLAKMAMSFSERFGSYSSQSDYGNFTDLKIFMSDNLKTWVDGYVAKLKSETPNKGGYYGITTTALLTEVKAFDEAAGQAEIIVTTERRESTAEINGGDPYVQKIDFRFVKVGSDWLMDEIYWEK